MEKNGVLVRYENGVRNAENQKGTECYETGLQTERRLLSADGN